MKNLKHAFKFLLKSQYVKWSATTNNNFDQGLGGSLYSLSTDTTLSVKALVNANGTVDAMTRLQALQLPGSHLMTFKVEAYAANGFQLISFDYKIADIDVFDDNLNRFIREQYDAEFTENLEATLSSP